MEHATSDVNSILLQRGSIYGSYSVGVQQRANILSALNTIHKDKNGVDMSAEMQIMFSDLILKLMRAAASPEYLDSWIDLTGYSTLIKDTMVERKCDASR